MVHDLSIMVNKVKINCKESRESSESLLRKKLLKIAKMFLLIVKMSLQTEGGNAIRPAFKRE